MVTPMGHAALPILKRRLEDVIIKLALFEFAEKLDKCYWLANSPQLLNKFLFRNILARSLPSGALFFSLLLFAPLSHILCEFAALLLAHGILGSRVFLSFAFCGGFGLALGLEGFLFGDVGFFSLRFDF
ncbi:hypothetical protein HG531_007368 [Fusarium graminearum]|nr:hypothetical protein HG531_007368 [Fusarium graminearum]